MSDFLRRCLTGAIVTAGLVGVLNVIFLIVVTAIAAAALGGPPVAAVLLTLLAGAFIFGAVVLVALVLTCLLQESQRAANVQAGTQAGRGQAIEAEDTGSPCPYCDVIRKRLVLSGAAAALVTALGIRIFS
jgi:hypothetical protein